MNWKDNTSYSQDDKERVPSSWRAEWGGGNKLRVTVHRHRDYEDDVWLLSTHPGLVDMYVLTSKDIEAAQREARLHLEKVIGDLYKELQSDRRKPV